MEEETIYQRERNAWAKCRASMTKDRFESANGKTPFGEKLSFAYLRKERFLHESMLVFGFVLKEALPTDDSQTTIHSFVLYSPEKQISENPAFLCEIARKIRDLHPKTKQEKQLKYLYESREPFAKPYRLEEGFSDGHEVYFCCLERHEEAIENFHLGLNPILIHPRKARECYFLPDAFWSDEFNAFYHGKEN